MVKVILVTSNWCHFCPTTKKLWKDIKLDHDFEYEEIDFDSPEGENIVDKYSISSVPTTIINDKIAFVGIPDKDKAIKALQDVS